ncbi:hypothetical protein HK096_011427, partial [Nowakowskiella sp. JEL0078]
MGALTNLAARPWGPWDLLYFCLFDRHVSQFDIPTLLVFFVDGFNLKKKLSSSLILHWLLRSLGGITYAIIIYSLQNDIEVDPSRPNSTIPPGWKWTSSIPSLGYYLGELYLDSYPFQKATVLAGDDKWLMTVAYAGLHILMVLSYCTLLVNIVRATEIRMVASTVLTLSASLLIITDDCSVNKLLSCKYTYARDVAVNISYSLFYLDYLVIKFGTLKRFDCNLTTQELKFQERLSHQQVSNFELNILNAISPVNASAITGNLVLSQ